jgi:glycosyltransferase involved in cell wall biosynthesis
MNAAPAVSVLLPVHNDRRFVGRAVESILEQTFRDFELLVLDDGSTDGSMEIVRGFSDPRLRIVSNPRNLGLARTLNTGLALAQGNLIARMDADDISEPARFERQVEFLAAHPEIALVGTWARWIDENDRPFTAIEFPTDPAGIEQGLMEDNCIFHPSVMFRRRPVEELGGYAAASPLSQDYELWLRLSERHPLANLPEYLLRYRIHRGQVSVKRIGRQRRAANAMRYEAARRRGQAGRLSRAEHYEPPRLLPRMRGAKGSTGAALVFWSQTFRSMGRGADALGLAALACAHSPLSGKVYAALRGALTDILWPASARNRAAWYATRLRSMIPPRGGPRHR